MFVRPRHIRFDYSDLCWIHDSDGRMTLERNYNSKRIADVTTRRRMAACVWLPGKSLYATILASKSRGFRTTVTVNVDNHECLSAVSIQNIIDISNLSRGMNGNCDLQTTVRARQLSTEPMRESRRRATGNSRKRKYYRSIKSPQNSPAQCSSY